MKAKPVYKCIRCGKEVIGETELNADELECLPATSIHQCDKMVVRTVKKNFMGITKLVGYDSIVEADDDV